MFRIERDLMRVSGSADRNNTKLALICAGAALAFGCAAYGLDRACRHFNVRRNRRLEALSDGAAHIATALAVATPALPFVNKRTRFLLVAALSSVAIDLDHVVAARSLALIPCMSMPQRPASHSLLTLGLAVYVAERTAPGTHTELAIGLGLGSHLLRDIATGGAPLFLPRRIISIARAPVALMILALGLFARWYSRYMLDPNRPRRSNPVVVGSRVVRGARSARRAA
jgi:hypothetical protein